MDAFITVLAGLPATFPVPVVVVQHRVHTTDGRDALASVLSRRVHLPVRAAKAGTAVHHRGVTVLPAATRSTIDPDGRWMKDSAREASPGDAVLASAAEATATIAVILTGNLTDGTEGIRAVKLGGGRVLVQDPSTARAPSMPNNAIATGCADFVLPLQRISTALLALATAPGGADLLAVPLPPWARLTS